ncbi:hypothetical protein NP493_271g03010 [Ridgeia piscesae]|uniref:Uncharacterized protein n=1 Tax=Ridgeia piscesae TaxID=27915 RepID=A0AAD9UCK8_RIDPI|nr:hypothetical protein NP493_271g03010 [Ridgeia piscesae]
MSACDVRHAYFSRGLHKVRSREHVVTYPQVSISSSHWLWYACFWTCL